MNITRFRPAVYAAFIITLCLVVQAEAEDWQWDHQQGKSLALKHGKTTVWQFNYGADQPKPHFHPVALPDGRVLTWDRPPDHAWHHGLWFSWKYINGVNYWEPAPGKDKPQGATEWGDVRAATRADNTARIDMDLTYRSPTGQAVLREQRTMDVSAPSEQGRYHLDWTSKFTAGQNDVKLDRTPPPGQPDGVPWGGYAGLSIRLGKDLSQRRAVTTDGPIQFDQNGNYRGKALAMDYQGTIDGKPLGVAVYDHPDNPNHPTPWYAIRAEPMSYFSPAVICYAPHTLKAGQSFTLRYRIVFHPGHLDAERLQAEYQQFVRLKGVRP